MAAGGRVVPLERLVAAIRPGETLFLPGSAGWPGAVMDALASDPERTRELDVWTSAAPGINAVPVDRLHPSARVTGFFMQPAYRAAQAAGRFRHLPAPYSALVKLFRERLRFETCVVQVAPPDGAGRCSLGPAVELTLLARSRSRRTLALVNPRLPPMPGAPSIPLNEIELAAEVDAPLPTYEPGAPSEAASAVANHVAAFVEDGAALQVGIGKAPDALLRTLRDRRGLRLHSGMLSDGALGLAEAGALDEGFAHLSCVWVGSAALYERLRDRPGFAVAGCERTHDARAVAALPRFTAVNAALSVDLFGQANLEHAGGRAVSGAGGAVDFATAARLSPGGLSVVALPATGGREGASRIVPRLGPGIATLSRSEVDVVVTEHGAADLRGRSVHERAEALLAVAAPSARDELAAAWRGIAAEL